MTTGVDKKQPGAAFFAVGSRASIRKMCCPSTATTRPLRPLAFSSMHQRRCAHRTSSHGGLLRGPVAQCMTIKITLG